MGLKYSIGRSSTGVYHLCRSINAQCNGRSGKFAKVHLQGIKYAQASSFCKKCFTDDPHGQIETMISQGTIE